MCHGTIHHNHLKFFINSPFQIVCGTGHHKSGDTGENAGHFTSPKWGKIHPEKILHKRSILILTVQKTAPSCWNQCSFISDVDACIYLIFVGDQL
jgi:hypothetical protein